MTLVPWWCLLLHVMGLSGHVYRHGKSWNGYNFHTYPHPAKKPTIPRDVMVDVINNVGLKLLAIHNEYNENNIAISPYGALSVVVALGEGLEGDAVHEIQQATHIPSDISVIRVGLRDIHRHLKSYFIPKEGFLAGLTLNHDNVTLRSEYEDILRFYGYDTATFNSALYPPPETSEIPETTTDEITTTASQITTEMGRDSAVEMTTEIVRAPTTPPEMTTSILSTERSLPATTTLATTDEPTISNQQITTTILPQTVEPITTLQTSTTNEQTTERVAIQTSTTNAPTTGETTVQISTVNERTTDNVVTQMSTTNAPTTEIMTIPVSTTNEPSTERVTTTEVSITEAGTTPSIVTIPPMSTQGSATEGETTETIATTREVITTSELLSSTELPTSSSTVEAGTTTSFTTVQTFLPSTNLPTTLIPSTDTSTIPPSETTVGSTTPSVPLTTESVTNTDGVTLSTNTIGDSTITISTDSTGTASVITETVTSTADLTTTNTTPNDGSTDNEIDSTDSSTDNVGFGGISKRRVRSEASRLNRTNIIKLNMIDDDGKFKRSSRSVVDYIIARYYDDQFNFNNNPEPYIPEEQPSFLVYGKYREYNINFMKYNTVLPFHYEPHLNALALSFPLDSTKYYLLLLLPVDETGIDKLVCDLRLNGSLKYIIANLKYRHVVATIPSFMLKGYVTLTPSFQKLGIRKVFEPRQADFSPMTSQRGIYVTNIEQAITVNIRNYVDPNAIPDHRNLHRYDPVYFKADHPFLYFVIDSDIHVTLMAGKIVNPLNSRVS